MENHQFKTNIKCGACVAQVTPHLDAIEGIENWEVNIQNPDKILTVVADSPDAKQVEEAVIKAGFSAEKI